MDQRPEISNRRRWPRRAAWAGALLLLLAAAAAARAEFNALAAVVEPRPAALALSAAAAVAFLLLARRTRRKAVAWAGLALSLGLLVFAVDLAFFTYSERPVLFESADGTVLAGTVYAPRSGGPHPGVVFVHGSGRETRAGFRYLAKLYARNGFAALAYDKRGAGESGGSTYEVGYDGYAADAVAAVRRLAEEPDVDRRRIGLFGHSEGGWVAPLAAREADPGFVIVTSTTHLTPARQVLYETGAELRRRGWPEETVTAATELQARVLSYQRTGAAGPGLEEELRRAAAEPWFDAAELPPELYPPEDYAWWRSVMDYDPVPHWRQVECSVLAVSGGLDTRSDVQASLRAIEAALAAGGNPRFTGRVFPGMDHGTVEWWLPFRLPPPRVPVGYPELLVSWSREAVGLGAAD